MEEGCTAAAFTVILNYPTAGIPDRLNEITFTLDRPFLFAITSFVLDFIPYFGSALACIIEAVVALFTGGLSMALKTVAFVLVVQQIEGNIVAPKLESRSVGIHPISVLFSLMACQQLWGPVGMLVSTPLAALVKMILSEIKDFAFSTDAERAAAPAHEPETELPATEPAESV